MSTEIHDEKSNSSTGAMLETTDPYLFFNLGLEIFGVKLAAIREVVEPQPFKTVPNTIPSFVGICNLRGQIIGLLDFRIHFGIKNPNHLGIYMIFENEHGAFGAIIDQIVCVDSLKETEIDRKNAAPQAVIPPQYIDGVVQYKEQLVILIDIKAIFSKEELTSIAHSKMMARAV